MIRNNYNIFKLIEFGSNISKVLWLVPVIALSWIQHVLDAKQMFLSTTCAFLIPSHCKNILNCFTTEEVVILNLTTWSDFLFWVDLPVKKGLFKYLRNIHNNLNSSLLHNNRFLHPLCRRFTWQCHKCKSLEWPVFRNTMFGIQYSDLLILFYSNLFRQYLRSE